MPSCRFVYDRQAYACRNCTSRAPLQSNSAVQVLQPDRLAETDAQQMRLPLLLQSSLRLIKFFGGARASPSADGKVKRR